ncbi:MAG: MauE/DoxX family redox-associated membrane protein, partial [Actinoplanes sp.]
TTEVIMQYVLLACRVVIGAVFLVSALSKVRRPQAFTEFAGSVGALVPAARGAAPALAAAGIAAEFAVAAATLWGPSQRWGLAGAALLLLLFSTLLALAIRRGVTTPCRCLGASPQPPGAPQLIRNAVLLAGCATGLLGSSAAAVHPAGAAVALGAAAVLVLLAVGADDLATLFESPTLGSQS